MWGCSAVAPRLFTEQLTILRETPCLPSNQLIYGVYMCKFSEEVFLFLHTQLHRYLFRQIFQALHVENALDFVTMPHPTTPPGEQNNFAHTKLFVNDGPLDPADVGSLRPSYPDEPLETLRARYQEDGYIHLKGLIPRADVLKARSSYFSYLAPSGVLAPNTTPEQGIFDASKDSAASPGIGAGAVGKNGKPGGKAGEFFVDRAIEAHTQDWYAEEFCKHPALRDFIAALTGWGENTYGVRRTLLRNNVPGNKAIGVHYDQIFLRHGEPTSVTAWVPIGDVSINGGGLIYLEKGK